MTKKLQISADSGVTWSTFPGSQGDLTLEMAAVTDTIFGFSQESQQPSIGQWNMTTNGIFKNVAGYNAMIFGPGTPTAMTSEATSLVSGHVYQITNAAHRVISYLDTVTVSDGATNVTASVATIDYLTGTIDMGTYAPTGAITVTGKYIPMTQVAKAKGFTLGQTQTAIDATCYDDAQANGGWRTMLPGLQTLTLQLNGIWNTTNDYYTTLTNRGIFYLMIDLNFSLQGKNVFHGYFKAMNEKRAGNVGALETDDLQMHAWVPDGALVKCGYEWIFDPTSTINPAIKNTLLAYQGQTDVQVRYLPAGTVGNTPLDGVTGTAFPIECSLANTVDGLNTFTFNFRGTSTPAKV